MQSSYFVTFSLQLIAALVYLEIVAFHAMLDSFVLMVLKICLDH
jgi:hypothetical protein